MKVYVVTKEGPEWSDILGIYATREHAVERAARFNDVPEDRRGTLDSMSQAVVTPHEVQNFV